ncbi:MAG: zinc ABC transporter substrate-binding protein [Rhodobacteraceae bacterium]|nr:zinc ABC transporter substrate-binding protein [Paracoccaceae bacterium]
MLPIRHLAAGLVTAGLFALPALASGHSHGHSHAHGHSHGHGEAHAPLEVVASFSILADFVTRIGGERVAVRSLVGPNGDAHVYQPSPSDARAVAGADLVVINGLGFEGWIERLIPASGYEGPVVVASDGIAVISGFVHEHDHDHDHAHDEGHGHDDGHDHAHDEGHGHDDGHDHAHHDGHDHDHSDADPHAWHDPAAVRVYLGNIAAALTRADPDGAAVFAANLVVALEEVAEIEAELAQLAAIAPEGLREIIVPHASFGYLERVTGLSFLAPVGTTTDAEPSARDMAEVIRRIRADGGAILFTENVSDPRLVEQIGRETGLAVSGRLYSDALSGPDGPAANWAELMRHNIGALRAAFSG